MTANTKVALTLSNSIIGVSILAMPFCMKQCGITLGAIMLLLSSLLTRFTCHLLLKSAHVSRRKTFEYIALHTFGPIGKLIVELNIIGFMLGILISFFVVIGDLGPAIISHALNVPNSEILRSLFLIFVGLGVALPFAMLREVKSLAQISTLSIMFYVILSLNAIVEALPVILNDNWLQRIHWWEPAGILQSLPIFALALSCQTQIFEIYDTLPDPSMKHMNAVVKLAVYICAILYFTVGFFGYIANHDQSFSGNILLSASPGFVTEVIKLIFVLSVALSFPLVVLPCRTSIHSLLFKRASGPFEVSSNYISDVRFKGITIVIVISTLIIGILCPNIEMVLEFIGSTIGIFICVIFPAMTFIQLTPKSTFEKWGAQFVFITGVLLLISCTWVSFLPNTVLDQSQRRPVDNLNAVPVDSKDYSLNFHPHVVNPVNSHDDANVETHRKGTRIPMLKSGTTSSTIAPSLHIGRKMEPHFEANVDNNKAVEVKMDDIKRQEPPVPQEPEEIKNHETADKPIKEQILNKQQAVAQVANGNDAVEIVVNQPAEDTINIKEENPDQTLIKQEELLKKMELQQEEQKKILEVQREILKELKAHEKIHGDTKENVEGNALNPDDNLPTKKLTTSDVLQQKDKNFLSIRDNFSEKNLQNPLSLNSKKDEKVVLAEVIENNIEAQKSQPHNHTSLHGNKDDIVVDYPNVLLLVKNTSLKVDLLVKKLGIGVVSSDGHFNVKQENDKFQKVNSRDVNPLVDAAAAAIVLENDQDALKQKKGVQAKTQAQIVPVSPEVHDVAVEEIPNLHKSKENDGPEKLQFSLQSVRSTALEGIPITSKGQTGEVILDGLKLQNVPQNDIDSEGKRVGRDLKSSV